MPWNLENKIIQINQSAGLGALEPGSQYLLGKHKLPLNGSSLSCCYGSYVALTGSLLCFGALSNREFAFIYLSVRKLCPIIKNIFNLIKHKNEVGNFRALCCHVKTIEMTPPLAVPFAFWSM